MVTCLCAASPTEDGPGSAADVFVSLVQSFSLYFFKKKICKSVLKLNVKLLRFRIPFDCKIMDKKAN